MLRNKIASSLFRSLLRWNRRPEVVASKFAVDPVVIGAKPFLPANVKELRDAEGVQAAIFQCFRNNEPTPESLDAGFKVLRELNEVGKKLSVRCEARANRASEVYQSLATFRVGQVVQHKAFNVRGIVTGWDLDETKSKQVVEVLPDLVDTNEFAGVYNLFETIVKVNSEDLQLVEDKDLHRIINRNVKNFFDGYDVVRRKYIPSPDLSYWYECDLKALENSANAKDNMSASQLRQLNKSLSATQRSIQGIAIDMKAIIAKHAPRLMLPTETETGNLNNTLSNIASTIPSDHVGRSMADDILEEVHKCIAGCMSEQPPTAPLPLPSQSLHARAAAAAEEDAKSMSVDTFRQPLRRGGIYRQHQITNPALTEDATAVIKSPRSGSKASSNSSMGAAEVEKIYYAVGYLGNCFSAVDQLLQLRFQARGVAYHDSLRVVPEEETSVPAGDNSGEGLSPRQSRVVEVAVADEMAKQKNAATMFPAAIYRVGQIVRNTELGYRGVICGFDQRPGQNLLAWEGIAGLKYGQEQPIYKILYDERDMADTVGRFDSRSYFLVAQENLEPVTERLDLLVNHRSVSHYFDGFDISKGCFRAPPKLAYCFPQRAEVAPRVVPWRDPATDIAESVYPVAAACVEKAGLPSPFQGVTDEEAATVAPVYAAIDELLVELFTYLRGSLAQTRVLDGQARRSKKESAETVSEENITGGVAQIPATDMTDMTAAAAVPSIDDAASAPPAPLVSMRDLLLLLKYARTQEHALYVESLLWLTWLAHASPEVCMLMRLSISHAKRGQMEEAIEVVSRVIELDPLFAEAYNKRASYHHMLKGYEDCIINANSSMEIFPDHVGALSGLGLCYEQQGKHKLAVKSVRKALDLHPWAAHLPTMLISMLAERKGAKGGSSSSTSTSTSTGASGSSDSSSSSESSSNSEVRDN